MKKVDLTLAQAASLLTLVISGVFMIVGAVTGNPALSLVFLAFAACALVSLGMPAARKRAKTDDQLPR